MLTRLLRPLFRWPFPEASVKQQQLRVLSWLLRRGRGTRFAAEHGLEHAAAYDDLRRALPEPVAYDQIRPLVMRMIAGERDVLWPGRTRSFAQSSGTSDGKSKYIPITDDALRLNHYAGGRAAVAAYLNLYPGSRLFDGKAFILGGSFANELPDTRARVGDLSATLIDRINPLVNLVRVPGKRTALLEDWAVKLPRLVREAAGQDVTNISGVPSWFLTVLKEVLEATGAATIHDVWPNLEVFFHGGIAFGPYREQYDRITAPGRMRYLETYNASEGFVAVQDSRDPGAMRLLADAGIFYEFIPLGGGEILAPWQVEEGKTYAVLLTACNGLWRYPLGDTVEIVTAEPLRLRVAGRTKHYINAFGEEVMVHNTDAALARACRQTGAQVRDYHACPVYAGDRTRGRHEWLVEFAAAPPDMARFAALLDQALRQQNSDYDAKRAGGLFLDPLTVVAAPPGLFDRWLASTGKLGGQRKIPRLANDRRLMDQMLAMAR